MDHKLFDDELIYLDVFDPDRDAEIEAQWTVNAEYGRLLGNKAVKPISAAQVKKNHKKDKDDEQQNRLFHFTIRTREDGRLIGFIRLQWIEWTNGVGHIRFGIGKAEDRRRGYGTDALRLALNYAFNELNLHRLSAIVPEYNAGAIRLLERAGFITEVRRRQAIQRDGRRWDLLTMGLLCGEWKGGA